MHVRGMVVDNDYSNDLLFLLLRTAHQRLVRPRRPVPRRIEVLVVAKYAIAPLIDEVGLSHSGQENDLTGSGSWSLRVIQLAHVDNTKDLSGQLLLLTVLVPANALRH
jgi:hypothetical protein